ncbi:MAG: PotD/PotF family extracellular solute-binding protein [Alphaproteobacteria bacterium]
MTRTTFRTTRRSFLAGTAAAASTLAVGSYLRRAYAEEPLKVSSYGGYFEDSLSEHIYPDFSKETGIPVESVSQEGGFSWFTVIETGAAAGKVPTDVTMAGGQAPRRAPHLFQPLDESKLPNVKNVPDYLLHRKDDGRLDAVAVLAWYTTFVTNTDVYPDPPKSWADAWGPRFKNALGWSSEADSSYLLDITAVTFFGGQDILNTREGLLKVMAKAAELKENVTLWYRDEGSFQQALQAGEVPAGQYYHDVTNVMAGDGFPVRSTFPKEGGVIDFGSWGLVKGSKKREQGHVFINYCCDPVIQAKITRKLGTAPVVPRKLMDLTDEEFAAVSSDIPPIVPAYGVYVKDGDWIAEKWTELITGAV